MTKNARELLRRALTLSEAERLALAEDLIESVDDAAEDPDAVAAAWKAELAKRVRQTLAAGEDAPGDDWKTVRARIERKLRAPRTR